MALGSEGVLLRAPLQGSYELLSVQVELLLSTAIKSIVKGPLELPLTGSFWPYGPQGPTV